MKRIDDCRLYGILDLSYIPPAGLVQMAQKMIEGGVDIIQIRAKNFIGEDIRWLAEEVHAVTQEAGVPLVINDHPDIAASASVEGVHIGQDDMDVDRTRQVAGYRTMIGKSTHSPAQAISAAGEDTDYLGFGPLFATPTKPDYKAIGLQDIRTVLEMVQKPVFCIGGIKLENLETVLKAGAKRVVIVSGILQAKDVTGYCRQVKSMLGE